MNEYSSSEDTMGSKDVQTPLARVRYGLAKEIQLFPDALVFIAREEGDEDRLPLEHIHSIAVLPGDKIPSKLLVVVEIEEGKHIIAAEGMTNVRDFASMLPILQEYAPHILLDPPDLADQLTQAMQNRRESNIGCYAIFFASLLLIVLIVIGANYVHSVVVR